MVSGAIGRAVSAPVADGLSAQTFSSPSREAARNGRKRMAHQTRRMPPAWIGAAPHGASVKRPVARPASAPTTKT